MAAVTVAFNGSRVNAADSNTNWSNLGGGGPQPASEAQLKYQGTGAVNRKVTSTSGREGVEYDPGSGAVDMRTVTGTNILWFVKANISDFGDLTTTYGVEVRLGSGSGAYYDYNIAGSGANRSIFSTYPAQGGYNILALDPNVSAWREGTTGTPDLQNVDYWGLAAEFVVGGAKSENVALDAIDVGTGLTLTRGDGGDADGTFQDFVTADQDDPTNGRWGVVVSKAGAIIAIGMLTIGESATATEFNDNDAVILFPDGYHSAGSVGLTVDIQNASTVISIGSRLIGRGSSTTEDTRPDLTVVGTSGTFTFSGTLRNFRDITLTSAASFDGAFFECDLLTQSSADVENSTFITTSATTVAALQDPTFGTTTDLHDVEFIQGGAGHAIEIDTAASYTLHGLTFSGYGADDEDDAAIYVSASSGTVTLNISGGGGTPTVKSDGATIVINNAVTLQVTVQDTATDPIVGARVGIFTDDSSETELMNDTTNGSGIASNSFNYVSDQDIFVRVRSASGNPAYRDLETSGTITTAGFTLTATLEEDPNVN